jgi:deoxyribonuclease IV
MFLGGHMSIAGGVDTAFGRGVTVGCTAMQIFTKNNNQWRARPFKAGEVERYHQQQAETGIGPVVAHASYLLNLGTPDDALWEKSIAALEVELERCQALRIPLLVIHPGAHMKSGPEAGLARVSAALDRVHADLPELRARIALELTAGQGTALGHTFEQLATIIDGCQQPERLAVCFDTCHALAAGYEFRTADSYEEMILDFDRVIGLEPLAVFHLNDSKKDLASRVDRHTHIGQGFIGLEPFGFLLNDPRFKALPFLLETPKDNDPQDDIDNLARLRAVLRPGA